MNNSGLAVQLAASFWQLAPSDIWVIHDEVDLNLGALRIRSSGSSAGHRGIASIIETLGTPDFWRFRVGVGHPRTKAEIGHKFSTKGIDDFVLEPFSHDELGKARELIAHTAKAIIHALEHDITAAGNKFNTR
jgi:peptidyl-tRNA hydrolase, PTH1 family